MEYVDSWLLTNVWMWWWEAESCQPPPSQCWMLECKVCIVSRCGNFTKIGWAEEWVEEGWEQCTMAYGKEISSTTFTAQTVLDCYRKIKIKWNENWVHTRDTMLVTSSSKLQHTHSALAQQWWLAAKWRVWQSTPRYSTCWVPPWQCSTQISTLETLETCPNTALWTQQSNTLSAFWLHLLLDFGLVQKSSVVQWTMQAAGCHWKSN